MPNPFVEVVHGLEWLGKAIAKPFASAGKIIAIAHDVEQYAATLLPDAVAVVDAAGALAVAAVKDGGVLVGDLLALIGDVKAGKFSDAIVAFEQMISDAGKAATFSDVLQAVQQLVAAYDKFGADGSAALHKLEQDASA